MSIEEALATLLAEGVVSDAEYDKLHRRAEAAPARRQMARQLAYAQSLRNDGMPVTHIAKTIGLPADMLYRRTRSPNAGNTAAREKRNKEIARLRSEGLTYRQIADRVGLTGGGVWRVLRTFNERKTP